ncbi:E3 ubiquitin-protein ligase hrd1 [Aspergillus nanangensis]|uniref:RING-type E3 ubiquitin transferase n=1 Tax=Aspergillus nanangensis TaxID=2582783 RepID=A0AAD4CXJ4_ASPNN|nr:E3 ubiquitin-protein ligase hrd1 [Aspergillus nanangensis]
MYQPNLCMLLYVMGVTTWINAAASSLQHALLEWPSQSFVTSTLRPPVMNLTKQGKTEPGLLFFTPSPIIKGQGKNGDALIFDNNGELVWQGPSGVAGLRPQLLNGEPVLTYWQGQRPANGAWVGSMIILNIFYEEIHRVDLGAEEGVGSGDPTLKTYIDMHETTITNRGTILVTVSNSTDADARSIGGPENTSVLDYLVYEIEVASNTVLFRWRATDHLPLSAAPAISRGSFKLEHGSLWDFVHLNSVEPYDDGFLLSSRMYCSVLAINRNGTIRWRLDGQTGGDFTLGRGTSFCWQHDVRIYHQTDQAITISLFNNGNLENEYGGVTTTCLLLNVDLVKRHVSLHRRVFDAADPVMSVSQGSCQKLGNGHLLVGYGSAPKMKEFDKHGACVMSAQFSAYTGAVSRADSYRAFRASWIGRPRTKPSVVACLVDNRTIVFWLLSPDLLHDFGLFALVSHSLAMRLAAYAGASVALATGVFLKALHQRSNFYSACVYLSQSSANLMILTNVCLLAVGFILFWLQRLLYGPLRPIETEQLYEKAWFAITETCLAMTIFRGELGAWFLVMFVCLLVGKVWGWISEGRVEYLEQQPPANPRLFHTRLSISVVLSVLFNLFLLRYCVTTVLEQARPDMMVMFGFEFAVLTILSSSTAARYSISLVEIYITRQQMKAKVEERRQEIRDERADAIRQAAQAGDISPPSHLPNENDIDEMELDVPGWEEKGRWIFYLDLLTDFLKLTVYLTFFAILFTFYGLPIHILRDVVVTIRSFCRRIMDFMRYRSATRDMNERYPDATAEEVSREEVCIICREEMTPWQQPNDRPRGSVSERLRPKKLPCGHILHFACLRSWLERQQNCPTCRRPVLAPARPAGQPGDGVNGGQAQGVAGAQPNFPGANQQAGRNVPGGGPRARVYQFGPFRIGFGAGRGDLFQNLHQQIHQGNAPLPPMNNANHPDARQIGFGFGFGRPPAAPGAAAAQPTPTPTTTPALTPTSNAGNMELQLLQMEQQIMREISSLRITVEQLQLVRMLQSELQRLRQISTTSINTPEGLVSNPPTSTSPLSTTTRRQFTSGTRAPTMTAGDSRLPEGLNLPQGWSLMPLQSPDYSSVGAPAPTPAPVVPSAFPSPYVRPDPANEATPSVQPSSTQEPRIDSNVGNYVPAPNEPVSQGLSNWESIPTPTPTSTGTEQVLQDLTQTDGELQQPKTDNLAADEAESDGGEESSSPSKGKARVATVEDAVDEGT